VEKPSGAQLLLLLREGHAADWESLCRALGRDPRERNSLTFWIAEALQELVAAGLVKVEGLLDPPSFEFPTGRIVLTRQATLAQHALGVSLPEAAKMKTGRSMVVEPFFGTSGPPDRRRLDLFMLMPFSDELRPVYEDHIKKVSSRLSLQIARADDFFSAHEIMKDIWRSLVSTTAVIADCTGRNPNVFYEIGIAHTLGKPVILITQTKDDVPFDLRAVRYIEYQFTPRGMKQFEKHLEAAIRDAVS
jgi:hypothetical protein